MIKYSLISTFLCLSTSFAFAADLKNSSLAPKLAAQLAPVVASANERFGRLPSVALTNRFSRICGGDRQSDPWVRYCSSKNVIYVDAGLAADVPDVGAQQYLLAHAYGHAIQVRHGVASFALRLIRSEPQREAELRGYVTRQVECLAGVLIAAGTSVPVKGPSDWFNSEPFRGSHWGASPIRRGPQVSIGLGARHEWYLRGRTSGQYSSCAVGEMGTTLIEKAAR